MAWPARIMWDISADRESRLRRRSASREILWVLFMVGSPGWVGGVQPKRVGSFGCMIHYNGSHQLSMFSGVR